MRPPKPRGAPPRQARVEGLAARRAALRLLDAVLRRGETLTAAVARSDGLPPNDAALALAIAGEALRRLPTIDRWIDGATRQLLPDDSKARAVLRLALAQKLGLDTPDHAIVATALPLVDGGPRRLVHGVLGTLLRGAPPAQPGPLPEAVEQRWRRAWGEDVVAAARAAILERPPLDLSFRDEASAAIFRETTGAAAIAPASARLDSVNPAQLPGYEAGDWWVQDVAASLPARLLPRRAGRVLDLCAAPGGKTLQLAAAGHHVTALDSSAARLDRLRQNLDRTGLAADIVTADLLAWTPPHAFDAILLDAPCSATGTFRRHPEVLYRAGPRLIADMADLQRRMIARAADWLAPGGTLVYATCSLEREEGETVVADFLAAHPAFSIVPPAAGELPDFVTPADGGGTRVLPGALGALGGADGFFIARLVRTAE